MIITGNNCWILILTNMVSDKEASALSHTTNTHFHSSYWLGSEISQFPPAKSGTSEFPDQPKFTPLSLDTHFQPPLHPALFSLLLFLPACWLDCSCSDSHALVVANLREREVRKGLLLLLSSSGAWHTAKHCTRTLWSRWSFPNGYCSTSTPWGTTSPRGYFSQDPAMPVGKMIYGLTETPLWVAATAMHWKRIN